MSHSKKIKDVFRYCIRKDPFLAKHLDQQNAGIDKSQNPETVQTSADIALQPSSMEVDAQFNLDKLVSKNPAMSELETTLDELKGDGQNLLAEFVDWQAAGPTYSFAELRNELCGDAKILFNEKQLSLYGLVFTCKESKKEWLARTIELLDVDYNKHPITLDEL